MNNLDRAESHRRLKARIIYQDEQYVSIHRIQIDNISCDIENVQLSNNPRNSYLALGSWLVGMISAITGLLNLCFPEEVFLRHLFIMSSVATIFALSYLFYQYKNSKPLKSKTLEEIKELLSKHKERNTVIDDMPFNEPPRSLNPPLNNGLRIESG